MHQVEIKEGPTFEFGIFDTDTGEEIAHFLSRETAERVAESFRDSARLDAIVANEWFIADEETDPFNGDPADEVFDGHRFAVLSNKGGCVGRGGTARAAIDDAIEQISVSNATP